MTIRFQNTSMRMRGMPANQVLYLLFDRAVCSNEMGHRGRRPSPLLRGTPSSASHSSGL